MGRFTCKLVCQYHVHCTMTVLKKIGVLSQLKFKKMENYLSEKKKKIVSLTGVKAENTNKKCIDEFDMLCIDLKKTMYHQFNNFKFYFLVVLKFCLINLLHL